ncbi:MAG: hypothetical protein ACHQQS_05540 [Thermoanaerobaculales bacterium]
MPRIGRIGIRVLFAGAILLASMGTARSANTVEPCCFANEAFTGVCRVVPGPNESCASILAYLNDPNTSGKTYCGASSVRGRWRQVACPSNDGSSQSHDSSPRR